MQRDNAAQACILSASTIVTALAGLQVELAGLTAETQTDGESMRAFTLTAASRLACTHVHDCEPEQVCCQQG